MPSANRCNRRPYRKQTPIYFAPGTTPNRAIYSWHNVNGREHPLYRTWAAIIQRCTNSNIRAWKNYGGRGISVHEPWREFVNFLLDVWPDLYEPGFQIDRIDNNGNYEPGNIRWVDQKTQQNNKRKRGGRS